jgi:microcystin-dependent protein
MKLPTIITLILGAGACLHAGVPTTLNYQGRIMQNGQPFDGTGHFVFGIYEGSTLLWTNKLPVPSPLNDPATAVDSSDAKALAVRNGIFNVRLGDGDANNAPVGTEVFFKFDAVQRVRTDVKLKVWFSPTAEGPYTKLEPDVTFASVPFAQTAAVAESAIHGVPAGTVVPFAAPITDPSISIPQGWALCNGQTLDGSQPENSALFAAIGLTYGGSGMSFNVPDLRGRTVIGTGQGDTWTGAGGATNWTLGTKFGAEKHQMTQPEMPAHSHEVADPGHSHNVSDPGHQHQYYDSWQHDIRSDDANDRTVAHYLETGESRLTEPGYTGISIYSAGTNIWLWSSGGSQPHNNMQPSIVLNYIIKL